LQPSSTGVTPTTTRQNLTVRSTTATKRIRLVPNHPLPLINRGVAYNGKGDFVRAIADFDQAIALAPALTIAFFDRCIAYNGTAEFDAAILFRGFTGQFELSRCLGGTMQVLRWQR
jgi:lipoprotein NlpI